MVALAAVVAAAPLARQTRDVDGVVRDLFRPTGSLGVLLFVSSDCPVSNGYAPEIQRLCDVAKTKGGACTLVYEDPSIDAAQVRKHRDEYRYRGIPAVIDSDHAIAGRAKATITPEALVLTSAGVVKYRGRVDDKYVALGQQRRVVTSHDLADAIDAVVAGRPVPRAETQAVGCFIPH
jgi:hypothetical protein